MINSNFDWKEYYNLSKYLFHNKNIQSCNRESQLRTAISRSYYAAFWTTRIFLKEYHKITIISIKSVHSKLIDELNLIGDARYRILSTELFELKRLRQIADYENNAWNLENRTELALNRCNTILDTIDKIRKK